MWQLETQLFASSYTWLAYIFEASYSTVVTSVSKKSSANQSELKKLVLSHCQTYYMHTGGNSGFNICFMQQTLDCQLKSRNCQPQTIS